MSKPDYATHVSSCRCRSCNAEFRRAQKAKCTCPRPSPYRLPYLEGLEKETLLLMDPPPCWRCQVLARRR